MRYACRFAVIAVLALATGAADAQSQETFKARLGIAPTDANNQPFVTGAGTVTAVLRGMRLSVSGTFQGLQTPATTARLHLGPKGIRGAAILDLTATKATAGTLQGEFTLTAAQVDHLKRARLYVQVNSEKAADGNLWGWLLP